MSRPVSASDFGAVALVAALGVVCGSAVAYGAEHAIDPGFKTYGDSLWWGIVTLTTVGYGDIVPKTTTVRVAGILIMFTGVAVVGLLAGSLASFFRIDASSAGNSAGGDGSVASTAPPPFDALAHEVAAMRDQLAHLTVQLARFTAPGPMEPESPSAPPATEEPRAR